MIDSQRIIVSLDGVSDSIALNIAKSLSGMVWGFKVNDLIYEKLEIVDELKKVGRVFVDVKLHDIPNTVANSVKRLSKHGADIITVHASGGVEMMQAAKSNAGATKIIAVTVLTSQQREDSKAEVKRLSEVAVQAGVDGVVCSGQELDIVASIDEMHSKLKIVPGIRPTGYKKKDDQVRTMTPREALQHGADYLVVGRPITQVDNPKDALKRLCGGK